MKSSRIAMVPVAVLSVGAVLMFVFLGMRSDPPKRAPEPRTRIVGATVMRPGTVRAEVRAFGTVTSAQELDLYAEVAGTLMPGDVPFLNAQRFDSGDVLLKIDDRQIQLDRRSAISDLLSALANVLPEIKVSYPNAYAVWQGYFDAVGFDTPIPPLPEARTQQIKLFLSRYNVYKLYYAVRNLEIRLEKHTVRAQFDGTIVAANKRAGSSAGAGTLLGRVVNLQTLEVELPIPAREVAWIDRDSPVHFTSTELEGTWTGAIERVGHSIDERTQTITAYARLDASQRPIPDGAFLKAEFTGKPVADAIVVPQRSVYEDRYVYVVRDGRLAIQDITIARQQEHTVIIRNGLVSGDTLVVEPLQGVAPGMLATPRFDTYDDSAR